MCNFELSPEAFRQRRIEMIALADERRLARALRRSRVPRVPGRRRERAVAGRPAGLFVRRPVPVLTDG